jgi:hypothetical protein
LNGYHVILLGFVFIVYGLLTLFSLSVLSINPFTIIIIGIMIVIGGLFVIKGFRNKTFYMAMFTIVALLGLNSLFGFIVVPQDKFDNYLNLSVFFVFLILYTRAYFYRWEARRMPWKNSW